MDLSVTTFIQPEPDSRYHSRVEEFSASLFGRKKRLELMALLARDYADSDAFYASEVAEKAGCRVNDVWSEITGLDRAGLVEYVGAPPGGKPKFYRLRPSPMWQAVIEVVAELDAEQPAASQRPAPVP